MSPFNEFLVFTHSPFIHSMSSHTRECVCVCVCVCARKHIPPLKLAVLSLTPPRAHTHLDVLFCTHLHCVTHLHHFAHLHHTHTPFKEEYHTHTPFKGEYAYTTHIHHLRENTRTLFKGKCHTHTPFKGEYASVCATLATHKCVCVHMCVCVYTCTPYTRLYIYIYIYIHIYIK